MKETRDSISQWAEETFGPAGSDARIWARANEEMAELLRLLTFEAEPDPAKVAEECADVAIVLARLAHRRGWEWRVAAPALTENTDALWYATRANAKLASLLLFLNNQSGAVFGHWLLEDALGELHMVCVKVRQSMTAAINRKMHKNRNRVWRLDGSGHGYHVKEAAEVAAP